MYEVGKEIIQKYREIEDSLQSLSRSVAGTVRVATVYSVGLYEMSPPLKRYLQAFPEVNIHLEYTRANKIYDEVSRGDVDLGVVAYPSKRPQILVTPFREDRLVLICAPQHPFAAFSEISIKRLDGENFIGFERDIATRRALDRVLRRNGVKVQYVMEMDNIETIKRGVEVGAGISIVPEPAIGQEVKNETLVVVQLADETLTRPLGIISKRGRRFTPAVQEFIDFLRGKMIPTPIEERGPNRTRFGVSLLTFSLGYLAEAPIEILGDSGQHIRIEKRLWIHSQVAGFLRHSNRHASAKGLLCKTFLKR